MIICPKCGYRVDGYPGFCTQCGASLRGISPRPSSGSGGFRTAGEDELTALGSDPFRAGHPEPSYRPPKPAAVPGRTDPSDERRARGKSTSFRTGRPEPSPYREDKGFVSGHGPGRDPGYRIKTGRGGGEKLPYSGRSGKKPALQTGRLLKGLICIPVALILVTAVVIFFEIDLGNMSGYVDLAADKIRDLSMFSGMEHMLGLIAVYGLALMILLGSYMLPARISKAIYKTCSIGDKVVVTIAGYFLIAFIIFLKMQVYDQGIMGYMFSQIFKSHGTGRLMAVIMFAALVLLLMIPVLFIIWSSHILVTVIVNNIKVNGPVLGIIAAIYELLSSVFVTALVLCAFCFGVAIILLPFIILAACSSGTRVVYDDYGNVYYIR